jgi:tetratricopeptide (TPR) repeat protein
MFRCLPALLAAGLLALSGCVPESSPQDEDRDAHVLAGRQRLLNRDVDGAISEFEQALQVNPKNSTAHFELAVAYKELKNDDASAIYHFQKCIFAQPKGPRRTLAEQRARISRQDLARAEQESTSGMLDHSACKISTPR